LEKIKYLCKIPCPPSQRPASVWSKRKRRGRDRRLETQRERALSFQRKGYFGKEEVEKDRENGKEEGDEVMPVHWSLPGQAYVPGSAAALLT
jgi:hypothetical protein